ncbi:MAG: LysM peptidoglycan-binding domain-containing protein [Anaerolineae bacterium]
MANNNDFEMSNNQNSAYRMRPIFVVANLFAAIFLAILISSFDNMSVRGGGFSVYAGPSDGSGEQYDENGELIQGESSVILVATNTPTPASGSTQTPADSEATATVDSTSNQQVDVILPPITATILSVNCDPPAPGTWFDYEIQRGDSLGSIASQAGTTSLKLQEANCLETTGIKFGETILVPNKIVVVATTVPSACMAPPGDWQPYTVQRGNNVFRISTESGITKADLVKFNCLPSESVLFVGQTIYLPPTSPYLSNSGVGVVPVPTVQPAETAAPSATPAPTNTPLPTVTETVAATPTEEIVRPEETPTVVTPERPEETPTLTQTATAAPTELPPTEISTQIPTEVPTEAPTAEPTVVATPLPVDTATPIPTLAPTASPTEIPTEIPTEVPTQAPTAIPAITVIPTESPIPTETTAPVETAIPAPTEVPTEEPTVEA